MARPDPQVRTTGRPLLKVPIVERDIRVADVDGVSGPVNIVDVHGVAAGRARGVEYPGIARPHELHPADEVLGRLVVTPIGPPRPVEIEPPVAVIPHAVPRHPLLV